MTGTVRDVVRSFLIASGVTKICGNPGSTEMRFFKDWPDDLDYVMVPQEAPALAMADGYSAFCVALLLAACGSNQSASPADTAKGDAIISVVRDTMTQAHLRSAIVRVTIDGREIVTRALGESMTGVPATTDMHFRNGAVAISYVSMLC